MLGLDMFGAFESQETPNKPSQRSLLCQQTIAARRVVLVAFTSVIVCVEHPLHRLIDVIT